MAYFSHKQSVTLTRRPSPWIVRIFIITAFPIRFDVAMDHLLFVDQNSTSESENCGVEVPLMTKASAFSKSFSGRP